MNMKRLLISFAILSIFSLFFISCYYDNEEALYPTLSSTCDTSNVTFSGIISPILANNCYSCHSDANAAFGGNIHLQSIADVITNSPRIVVSIKQTGSKPMPPGGKLNACAISQFDIWVRNGMPNK
jgi:hypothetical protein